MADVIALVPLFSIAPYVEEFARAVALSCCAVGAQLRPFGNVLNSALFSLSSSLSEAEELIMPTTARQTSSRRRAAARAPSTRGKEDAIKLLKADHKEVSDMVKKFESGRLSKDRKAAIAKQICLALTVHAQIEEEIFYPAARDSVRNGEDLLDEAEVEHASIKQLIATIEGSSPGEELFEARVTVLGEYVKHHVKEEETQLFPKIRKSDMDLQEVGAQLMARKKELMRAMKGDA